MLFLWHEDHLYAKLSHLLNLLHSHDLVREKKKCEPKERGEGGGDEGLILLVLRRHKRNLAKEMAKATPNFNKRGFISLCSFIIIIQKPLSVAKFHESPHKHIDHTSSSSSSSI